MQSCLLVHYYGDFKAYTQSNVFFSGMWKLLLCLVFMVSSTIGTPLNTTKVTILSDVDLSARYRLSGIIKPMFYDVILFIDPDNDSSFHGSVEIRITAEQSVKEITLHALEMEVSNIVVERAVLGLPKTNLYKNHILSNDDRQFLTIKLSSSIDADVPYYIKMDFIGKYASDMFGIYVSNYNYDGQAR